MISNKYQRIFLTNLTIIISILGIANLQNQNLTAITTVQEQENYVAEEKSLKASIAFQQSLPSFGLNNLIADWTYLQFAQYFGDGDAREITGYSLVTEYFASIVNRDPNFVQAHLNLSTANSLFAARPNKTVELIDKALETVTPATPNYPFLLWTYKATDEIIFLGDLDAAKNSYRNAAKWADWRKDDIGNEMAGRYRKTASFLATNPSTVQAQFGAWMTALSGTQDPKTKAYIINQLKILGAEINTTPNGQLNIKPPKSDRA